MKRNFDFSTLNNQGQAVIHIAVRTKYDRDVFPKYAIKEYLANAPNTNLDILSSSGSTAFYYAINHQLLTEANMLLDAGANPSIFGSPDRNPFKEIEQPLKAIEKMLKQYESVWNEYKKNKENGQFVKLNNGELVLVKNGSSPPNNFQKYLGSEDVELRIKALHNNFNANRELHERMRVIAEEIKAEQARSKNVLSDAKAVNRQQSKPTAASAPDTKSVPPAQPLAGAASVAALARYSIVATTTTSAALDQKRPTTPKEKFRSLIQEIKQWADQESQYHAAFIRQKLSDLSILLDTALTGFNDHFNIAYIEWLDSVLDKISLDLKYAGSIRSPAYKMLLEFQSRKEVIMQEYGKQLQAEAHPVGPSASSSK